MKKGNVYNFNQLAGYIEQDELGYRFYYDKNYLAQKGSQAISLTLPLTEKVYESKMLFAFFDGLIPEGWLLNIAIQDLKIDYKNRMDLLLTLCEDCIGSVHIERAE